MNLIFASAQLIIGCKQPQLIDAVASLFFGDFISSVAEELNCSITEQTVSARNRRGVENAEYSLNKCLHL